MLCSKVNFVATFIMPFTVFIYESASKFKGKLSRNPFYKYEKSISLRANVNFLAPEF